MTYLEEQFSLEGRVAVITGGGGAICGAIAKGYLNAGAEVLLWGRALESLESKRDELKGSGCAPERIHLVKADLSSPEQIDEAITVSLNLTGHIDILVNGVGGSSVRTSLLEVKAEDYENVLKLNLLAGCLLPSQAFCSHWMKTQREGTILNIASMASYVPLSGAWAYSAAKAAVVNQTMAMAAEMSQHGIRVNAIAPGFFLGKQNRSLLLAEDGSPTERGRRVLAHTPAGRFGNVDELCSAAIFLVSGGSSFISGATIPVDGAYLCANI
jgi:NAD(P)-dependent dehydrogenase (short-subunit alcohol dehydrogenase family)